MQVKGTGWKVGLILLKNKEKKRKEEKGKKEREKRKKGV